MHMLSIAFPLLLTVALAAQSPGGASDAVPRYRLEPGQKLTYVTSGTTEYPHARLKDKWSWTIWVTRRNADGSWRLVVRCATSSLLTEGDKPEGNPDERTHWIWCDVFDDGRIPSNEFTTDSPVPTAVFPRLPDSALQLRDGWCSEDADGTRTRNIVPGATDPSIFAFDVVSQSVEDAVYLIARDARCTFDCRRGLLTENAERYTRGDSGAHGIRTTTLQDAAECDAGEIARLDADCATCFAALRDWSAKIEQASSGVRFDALLLAEAKLYLLRARRKVTDGTACALLDDRLAVHDQRVVHARAAVEQRAAVMDKPSPAWEATDLQGAQHSVAGHAGEVMVLDFWYRGCGWCIKAMPQVKEVAAHFAGKPVVVLGMNTDRDVADAQFVVDKMQLGYPTLKAQGIPEKYGIHGFPTLVIVDRHGVVRGWHVGYSPTLRDEVVAAVEKLLAQEK